MYKSVFSYIFPTWFLHYKHVFLHKTMDFDRFVIWKSFFSWNRLGHIFICNVNHYGFFHRMVNIEISFIFVNKIWTPNLFVKYFNSYSFSVRDF